VDYMIPSAPELPNYTLERTVTPSPSNPLGVKGVGEAGTIGAPPAVMNSILDALEPFGVKHLDMPALPMRVWEAIQKAKGEQAGEWERGAGLQADEADVEQGGER
jgi:carbon-monoxide dehydrogenase large subunit